MINEFIEKWNKIALSTDPSNRSDAERGINAAYKLAGLDAPEKIFWAMSPKEATKIMFEDQCRCKECFSIDNDNIVKNRILSATIGAIKTKIRESIHPSILSEVSSSFVTFYRDSLYNNIAEKASECYPHFNDDIYNYFSGCAQPIHDLFLFDYINSVLRFNAYPSSLNSLMMIAKNCGMIIPSKKTCIAIERPSEINLDKSGNPHCDHGAAIKYRDEWSIYSWHGTLVPKKWIVEKEANLSEIIEEENLEKRSAAIDIFGWDRIINALNYKVIDRDTNPLIGELVEVQFPSYGNIEGRKEKFLRVLCGTGKQFALLVTNFKYNTAKECNAATYGWKPGLPIDLFIPTIRT